MVSPLLPVLRLDLPNVGGAGQHICTLGSAQRSLTLFYPFMFLILVIGTFILICIIFGRALCGWVCPIGLFQDFISRGRNLTKANAKEISQKKHDQLSLVKYAILILTLFLGITIGISVVGGSLIGTIFKEQFPGSLIEIAPYCQFCPTPILRHMVDFYFLEFDPQLSNPLSLGLFSLFFLFVIGAIIMPRFWCRYFCPMGAFSSLFNKVSLLSIQKEQSKCTKCNYCVNVCPTRVHRIKDEDVDHRVTDMNCIICLDCIEKCPEKALSLTMGKKEIYRGGKKGWWE
ncbi:MAG: 4Fe-4S binding protein, partial [Promethearchaeota archaeon]